MILSRSSSHHMRLLKNGDIYAISLAVHPETELQNRRS